MIWETQHDIRWLQIELTSLCQAGCIDCNRWRQQDGKWVSNGFHNHFNKWYDTKVFRSHIGQFTNLRGVSLCGNVGDPMAHPHIGDCVDAIWESNLNCDIDISTNGALGTIKQYELLAQHQEGKKFSISFAIDGLEDTNHIYRRGVIWKDVMKRVETFIQAGGQAVWVWIDFPHTRHQLEQAKKLSKELGFQKFQVRQRFTQTDKFDNEIVEASKQPVLRNQFNIDEVMARRDLEGKYIKQVKQYVDKGYYIDPGCKVMPDQDFYHPCPHLNVDGTLWPCCYTANGNYHKNLSTRQWWIDIDKRYGENWNNLHNHTVDKILQTDFFTNTLEKSWHKKKLIKKNLICYQNCGKCSD